MSNLMFAGRNISATHVAFSSTRVMATCAVIGQGVGTAAALAAQKSVLPSQIAADEPLVKSIQQRLLGDDAFLIGQLNEDRSDLARAARIIASSEQEGGEASNVVSGQTRSVHGESGVPVDRAATGSHRWMSAPGALPAWLQFDWDEPRKLQELQLVFDTGMHRHLTLSHHDGYTSRMRWGQPQPETVSNYEVQIFEHSEWKTVCTVIDNYQRLRRHRLPKGTSAASLRILVTDTNGLDHARIMEVRIQ